MAKLYFSMKPHHLVACGTFVLLLLIPSSCGRQSWGLFGETSPWEQYAGQLEDSGIDRSLAGKAWMSVSEKVLQDPLSIELPFEVKGVFKSKSIDAYAYRVNLQKGGSIQLKLQWAPVDSSILFLDIFRLRDGPERINSLASCDKVCDWEVPETGSYIFRIQPELLGEGNFSLEVTGKPTFSVFPVQGKDARAVQSMFGVSRDGGVRKHEGVDIFAEKGTPVVAPVKGVVTAVREGGKGGKSVWMRDFSHGYQLYFAHLDTQLVSFGQSINPGQVIGLVGNTGNAKFTPPHLHFGVYDHRPFDPFPLINNRPGEPRETELALEEDVMTVRVSRGNLRHGPGTDYPVLRSLKKNEAVFIDGATGTWYQVHTPDGIRGFMHKSLLGDAFDRSVETVPEELVLINPFSQPHDSLRLKTDAFSQVGYYNDYSVIADTNRNVYYLP